jgi:hypothetical protein
MEAFHVKRPFHLFDIRCFAYFEARIFPNSLTGTSQYVERSDLVTGFSAEISLLESLLSVRLVVSSLEFGLGA